MVGALFAAYFLVFLNRVAPNVLAPDLARDFALNASELGAFGSIYFWVYAILQVPAGILLDRIGTRRVTAAALVVAALGNVLLAFAPTYGLALLGRALVGAGSVPFYLGIQLAILHWFRRREFGTMSGVRLMVGNLGGLVATQPLALLAESTGWRESLLILSAVMLAVSALVALLVRDKPQDVGLPPLEEQLAPDVEERLPLGRALRIAWGLRSVWLLAAMYFLVYGAVNAFQGLWAVPFLIDARGLDRASAAGLLAWWAWGTIVGAPAWGLLSDRVLHTRKGATVLGYALFALAWVPLALLAGTPSWALAPLMFVASFGSASIVLGTPLLMELIPRQVMGTTSGLVNATPFLGAAVFQSGVGLALDAFGRTPSGAYPAHAYQAVFAFCLLSVLVGTALLFGVRERASG